MDSIHSLRSVLTWRSGCSGAYFWRWPLGCQASSWRRGRSPSDGACAPSASWRCSKARSPGVPSTALAGAGRTSRARPPVSAPHVRPSGLAHWRTGCSVARRGLGMTRNTSCRTRSKGAACTGWQASRSTKPRVWRSAAPRSSSCSVLWVLALSLGVRILALLSPPGLVPWADCLPWNARASSLRVPRATHRCLSSEGWPRPRGLSRTSSFLARFLETIKHDYDENVLIEWHDLITQDCGHPKTGTLGMAVLLDGAVTESSWVVDGNP